MEDGEPLVQKRGRFFQRGMRVLAGEPRPTKKKREWVEGLGTPCTKKRMELGKKKTGALVCLLY